MKTTNYLVLALSFLTLSVLCPRIALANLEPPNATSANSSAVANSQAPYLESDMLVENLLDKLEYPAPKVMDIDSNTGRMTPSQNDLNSPLGVQDPRFQNTTLPEVKDFAAALDLCYNLIPDRNTPAYSNSQNGGSGRQLTISDIMNWHADRHYTSEQNIALSNCFHDFSERIACPAGLSAPLDTCYKNQLDICDHLNQAHVLPANWYSQVCMKYGMSPLQAEYFLAHKFENSDSPDASDANLQAAQSALASYSSQSSQAGQQQGVTNGGYLDTEEVSPDTKAIMRDVSGPMLVQQFNDKLTKERDDLLYSVSVLRQMEGTSLAVNATARQVTPQ